MLPENLIKEELSKAFVFAVAARAGFALEFRRVDMDSVDVEIKCNGPMFSDATIRSPELGVQLKATSNPIWTGSGAQMSFPLDRKNYDDLRGATMVPRILVVLCLPKDESLWLSQTKEELTLRNCAYWTNLKGLPEIEGGQRFKNVRLPASNLFSTESLTKMMKKLSMEENI